MHNVFASPHPSFSGQVLPLFIPPSVGTLASVPALLLLSPDLLRRGAALWPRHPHPRPQPGHRRPHGQEGLRHLQPARGELPLVEAGHVTTLLTADWRRTTRWRCSWAWCPRAASSCSPSRTRAASSCGPGRGQSSPGSAAATAPASAGATCGPWSACR